LPPPPSLSQTLLLDHSFAATSAGIARSSADMTGRLLGPNNELTDPCEAYRAFPAGCPSFVNIGDRTKAASDILALRTLLNAGGVETLDQVAGASSSLNSQTKRNAGVVIVINILYTNFYLPGGGIPFGCVQPQNQRPLISVPRCPAHTIGAGRRMGSTHGAHCTVVAAAVAASC